MNDDATQRATLLRELERAILDLLRHRRGTICPSEAARRVGGEDWRELMERTREAGRRLAARGEIQVMQRGKVVDPGSARGPMRYARSGITHRGASQGS